MDIEPTVAYGSIATMVVALLGFGTTVVINAMQIGRFTGHITESLTDLKRRLTNLEAIAERLTDVLIEMARSRTEITLMSKRIDDVQEHGSRRLAEIMAAQWESVQDWRRRQERD